MRHLSAVLLGRPAFFDNAAMRISNTAVEPLDAYKPAIVPLQEGPVHDAQWSPDGASFAVVAGHMPARTQVFDANCRMIADLGTGSHNLLRWNPQVRHHHHSCAALPVSRDWLR